ncbi:MAG: DNA repair protein RecO [Epulopiscium sp.]|nr:DNA repair protein RecO [Candidatus Epulonipiscium sp.]
MQELKTKGLVLREVAVGEADKIITIFTEEQGKISVSARGARKPRSRFVAGTQVFAYCDFILYKGKNNWNLSQVEVIETFHNLRNDIYVLSCGIYMMELLETVGEENSPNEKLLKLTLYTLWKLANGELDPKLVLRIYEWKVMSFSGFTPEVIFCVHCGEEKEYFPFFSIPEGGVLCEECCDIDSSAKKILPGTLYTIHYILSSDLKALFQFQVSPQVLKELSVLSQAFVGYYLDKKFKTLAFIEELGSAY